MYEYFARFLNAHRVHTVSLEGHKRVTDPLGLESQRVVKHMDVPSPLEEQHMLLAVIGLGRLPFPTESSQPAPALLICYWYDS